MESLFRYVAAPSPCGYLPEQRWSLEYEYVGAMTPGEYLQRLTDGWRRFGCMMFRPACQACSACQSLRVCVDRFRPDRSQRRARRANEGVVERRVGKPSVNRTKLILYDRYHSFQADHKGWPQHPAKDAASYADSFVRHPFPVEEWDFYLDGRLVGVGYVDVLSDPAAPSQPSPLPSLPPRAGEGGVGGGQGGGRPPQGGLSAIYFYYDPLERQRSLGVYNVLCVIDEAKRRGLPYAYLGYYVAGSPAMAYKTLFRPNQLRGADGVWRDFRS